MSRGNGSGCVFESILGPNVKIFLHGVDSWAGLLSEASDDEGGEADSTKAAAETSRMTALYMAAREQYSEMAHLILSMVPL